MSVTAADLQERLETHLMAHGLYVTNVKYHEGDLHVGYETADPGEGINPREAGRVLELLIEAREDGWEPTDVHGWVYDLEEADEGDPRAHWEAREGWFHALDNGNISETDFSTLVISTIDA